MSRNVYHAYRSGIRLLYTVLRKFKIADTSSIAVQVIANPGAAVRRIALSKTKSVIAKSVSKLGLQNARSVAQIKRAAHHASSALKFLKHPMAPLRNILAKFQKPTERASDEEKKAYEDIKQHFKDYCYFLWASTHQISIEEYHPGNSGNIKGAVDNSGLATSLDRGICDKDGSTVWLQADFSKNIVHYTKSEEWVCDSCSDAPSTGLGDYYDDLCTHGKDANPHGGWRMTGNKREVFNCQDDHRHSGCDEDEHYTFTCEELGSAVPSKHKHLEYE